MEICQLHDHRGLGITRICWEQYITIPSWKDLYMIQIVAVIMKFINGLATFCIVSRVKVAMGTWYNQPRISCSTEFLVKI